MLQILITLMIYLGAALMVYNIYGFIRYARYIKSLKGWDKDDKTLNIPIVLLIFFLIGYVVVGTFGNPDIVMAGILFGGSVFVYIIYRFLSSISEKIVKNEQLESKLKVAEESSRAKTSFLASISHEMRTPMNVILGLDELALKDPDIKPETKESLEKIGQSGRHLLEMINNILEMNDIQSGSYEIKKEEFSLREALDQVNTVVRTLCEKKGLSYDFRVSGDAAGWYRGDPGKLRQSLLKVLDNAVKFTDQPGTVRLEVRAVSEDSNIKTLKFVISDTGVGIAPEFLPRVFDIFTQEDSTFTKKYGGSGLSLAVTKETVELMGGTITAASEPGKGSTFTITLPLEDVEHEMEEAEAKAEKVELSGRRILVVEDIQENAEIVMDLLELEDVTSEHAENGKVAVDMFSASPEGYYDAVLMDLRMPVMDGLEATRQIRALDHPDARKIPIIALTANAFDSDVKATMDAGMDAHLAKPADSDLLYYTIKQQIAKREKSR